MTTYCLWLKVVYLHNTHTRHDIGPLLTFLSHWTGHIVYNNYFYSSQSISGWFLRIYILFLFYFLPRNTVKRRSCVILVLIKDQKFFYIVNFIYIEKLFNCCFSRPILSKIPFFSCNKQIRQSKSLKFFIASQD